MEEQESLNRVPTLVILTGESGAGKSTFVQCMNCPDNWYESSRPMADAIRASGQEVSHDTIHQYATQRYTENPHWQVPMILDALNGKEFLLYDGPRRIAEVQQLVVQYPKIIIVRIVASDEIRLQRLQQRDDISPEDFQRIKQHESSETQLGQILGLATITIENNGTMEELQIKVNKLKEYITSY